MSTTLSPSSGRVGVTISSADGTVMRHPAGSLPPCLQDRQVPLQVSMSDIKAMRHPGECPALRLHDLPATVAEHGDYPRHHRIPAMHAIPPHRHHGEAAIPDGRAPPSRTQRTRRQYGRRASKPPWPGPCRAPGFDLRDRHQGHNLRPGHSPAARRRDGDGRCAERPVGLVGPRQTTIPRPRSRPSGHLGDGAW